MTAHGDANVRKLGAEQLVEQLTNGHSPGLPFAVVKDEALRRLHDYDGRHDAATGSVGQGNDPAVEAQASAPGVSASVERDAARAHVSDSPVAPARISWGSNGCNMSYESVEDAMDSGDDACPKCGFAPGWHLFEADLERSRFDG